MANQPKLNNGFTARQDRFIDCYILNGGKQRQAAIDAGYSESAADTRAHELLKREDVQNAINNRVNRQISNHVPLAIDTIKKLAVSANSESVRLTAAQDILNRAGIRPLQETKQIQQLTTRAQYEEILKEIEKALKNREKVIESDVQSEQRIVNA